MILDLLIGLGLFGTMFYVIPTKAKFVLGFIGILIILLVFVRHLI